MLSHIIGLTALVATVSAHGYISSPAMRSPGDATVAACGESIADEIRRDKTSHVEGLPELAALDDGYHVDQCNLWLCKGMQFTDNAANVQTYAPGQAVNVKIALTIPHVGSANVSVVDTKTDSIIGEPLLSWPSGYADERQFYSNSTPQGQVDFNIEIPSDLGDKCATAGDCVIQWWWYGNGARQTYESCIDFMLEEA